MYYTLFLKSREASTVYKNNDIIFSIYRKWLICNICKIIDNQNQEIIEFSYFSFYWYNRLKIISQQLDKKIIVKNNKHNNCIIVDGNILLIKERFKILGKLEAKCFLNNKVVGEIVEESLFLKQKYNFKFYIEDEYNYYFLILFSMYSVGFADSAYI